MSLDSYTKFRDYCLRALGQDEDKVIKVNVSERQLRDRIEEAVMHWQDFHLEGSAPVSLYKNITLADKRNGYIPVGELSSVSEILTANDANKSNVEVMDDLDYRFHMEYNENQRRSGGNMEMGLTNYHINMEYLASMRHLFHTDRLFTFNGTTGRLILSSDFPTSVGPKLLDSLNSGDWNLGVNTTLTNDVEALPDGRILGSRIENIDGGINPTSISYTESTNYYPRGLRTFVVLLKSGTYTGRLKLSVKDRAGNIVREKVITPTTYWKEFEIEAQYKEPHINDYVFTIETIDPNGNQNFYAYNPYGFRNNFMILVGYQNTSPEDIDTIWNSSWLKRYAIALIKRQWAQNIKKFDGVQMAGGVTLNGQVMYDEASAELLALEEELELKWTMPLGIYIG